MEDPKERLSQQVSTGELERRWKAVREKMRDLGIDYLIMRNDEGMLGGYVKWFTDIPARENFHFTVIFPKDEEMTLVTHGPALPAEPMPPAFAVRGVKKRLAAPYFASAHYTSTWDGEMAVGVLKERPGARIGFVGRSFIPVTFFEYLNSHLPGVTFADATEEIDQIKAIKSLEEISLIRKTAELQDAAMEYVKKKIRPGLRDFEITAEVLYSAALQGSDRHVILLGSGPQGTPVRILPHMLQNRMVKEGDQISILIETNGPGGLWTELGRVITLGEPCQELQDAFGTALEAQQQSLQRIKPGVHPKDLYHVNNAFLEKRGYFPERRLYAHGQGYDFVERPLIRDDETMNLLEGMNLTIHPTATNETVWASVVDNYIVTEKGVGPCLHKTPKEIAVL
ncbi:MAG: M24 family metallopeptidase [Pseudomonadota bacterium]